VCLAVPGRILALLEEHGIALASVDFGGVRKRICIETLPGAAVGDWILVHAGFALQTLEPADARERAAWFGAPEAEQ
jgi:hydrogenase expression/formation protein HypC